MELKVGVKIILKNKEGKFLLLQRSKIHYPEVGGEWDIAGGRIESEATLMENLKREVMEETGLELKGEPKLLAAQDIIKPDKDKHVVRLTYEGSADGDVKLSGEHTEFKWVTLPEMKQFGSLDKYLKEFL